MGADGEEDKSNRLIASVAICVVTLIDRIRSFFRCRRWRRRYRLRCFLNEYFFRFRARFSSDVDQGMQGKVENSSISNHSSRRTNILSLSKTNEKNLLVGNQKEQDHQMTISLFHFLSAWAMIRYLSWDQFYPLMKSLSSTIYIQMFFSQISTSNHFTIWINYHCSFDSRSTHSNVSLLFQVSLHICPGGITELCLFDLFHVVQIIGGNEFITRTSLSNRN